MGSAAAVQVTQRKSDCDERFYYKWKDTPDTPQPASPFFESERGIAQERLPACSRLFSEKISDDDDDDDEEEAEDPTPDSDAGSLAHVLDIASKVYHNLLARGNSAIIPWSVNGFYMLRGAITVARTVIEWLVQQFGIKFTTVLIPYALLLWHLCCSVTGGVVSAVKTTSFFFLGQILHGWRWMNSPKDVLEFPIEAPADPTFYDEATVMRLIMSIKYDNDRTQDAVDDEDSIMYGYDISGGSLCYFTTFVKYYVRSLYWKLTSKRPVHYQ